MDSGEFSAVLRDLVAAEAELERTPSDQFARRQALRERAAELRTVLRDFSDGWTDHLSIDALRRRIAVVERRIEEHFGDRLSHTSGAQTGFGGGLDPKVLHGMNRAMDQAAGLTAMRGELARLRDRLAKLEGA